MVMGKRDGLLIAGGGLAGSLAAIAMAKVRPEVPILLVEETDRFGGEHISSFFDAEIDEAQRWLIDPLVMHRWPGYYVAFPEQSRKLKADISSFASERLDKAVRAALKPDQYRLNTKVVAVRDNELVLPGGEKIRADGAIDARGAANLSTLDLGWRKFVAREYRFPRPHRVDLPVLADATVDQLEGYHFVHCLPLSDDRLLVEDNYYSDSAEIDLPTVGARLDAYLLKRGWKDGTIEHEQAGALPIALGDDVQPLWRSGGARVARLGTRGGFFNPVTGHAIADAVRTALLLTEQRDFDGAVLHDLFEAEVGQMWRKREFFRSFNSLLFQTPAWDRHKMLASFYRLDQPLIARFHAGQLGVLDRMHIQSGVSFKAARPTR
jgi:lycopene beta-cyclase